MALSFELHLLHLTLPPTVLQCFVIAQTSVPQKIVLRQEYQQPRTCQIRQLRIQRGMDQCVASSSVRGVQKLYKLVLFIVPEEWVKQHHPFQVQSPEPFCAASHRQAVRDVAAGAVAGEEQFFWIGVGVEPGLRPGAGGVGGDPL